MRKKIVSAYIKMYRILFSHFNLVFDFFNSSLNHLVSQKSGHYLEIGQSLANRCIIFLFVANFPWQLVLFWGSGTFAAKEHTLWDTCGTFFTSLVLFLRGVHGVVLFLESKVNSFKYLHYCRLVKTWPVRFLTNNTLVGS